VYFNFCAPVGLCSYYCNLFVHSEYKRLPSKFYANFFIKPTIFENITVYVTEQLSYSEGSCLQCNAWNMLYVDYRRMYKEMKPSV
jgi:hypothetical protein